MTGAMMIGAEKPRVLIVTSEHLHPENLLGSIFELTQAKRLQNSFSVSILSTRITDSLWHQGKQLIKTILKGSVGKTTYEFQAIRGLKPIVRKYCIEGIDVYEAYSTPLVANRSFKRQMECWVSTAMVGYNAYSREIGTPHLLHAHGRYLMAGALALRIKKLYGIPFVYTEHSTWYRRRIAPIESKPVLRNILAESAQTIAVSDDLLFDMTEFSGMTSGCSIVHPNTFDESFEATEPNWARDKNQSIRLLTVASLDEKKGIDILLEAIHILTKNPELPSFSASIFGDGPLRNTLIRQTEQLGLSHIVDFKGTASKEQLIREYDRADVFVLPSRVETFGVVVIEALSRGCPVVVTRSGGPERFVLESDGEICNAGEASNLAESIGIAISKLPTYCRSEIRARAIDRWGGRVFLQFMHGIYHSVIAGRLDAKHVDT